MKIEDLFKVAEEKYQCIIDEESEDIKIKYDYFTIFIEQVNNEISVRVKRGNTMIKGLYSMRVMSEMLNNNFQKILDFCIFSTIESFYAEKCKSLL